MTESSSTLVLIVTYGSRWKFLSRVTEAVLADLRVVKLVVVDNGSLQKEELHDLAAKDSRVHLVHLEKNIGSAGGFARGLEEARKSDAVYVLLLDDDIVPEYGFVEAYLKNYELIGDKKAVLCGNRIDIPGNEEYFTRDPDSFPVIRGTFFEVFSWEKLKRFLQIAKRGMPHVNKAEKRRYLPSAGFAYGGTFLPMEAVQLASLPDKDLVLYYDDIEYSWNVLRAGFQSYLCTTPILHDIDMSFGEQSQAVGLCDPKTAPFKAYYFLRNRIRVSIRNTQQSQAGLLLNVLVWMMGLYVLGIGKYGVSLQVLARLRLLTRAAYGAYVHSAPVPKEVALP